MLGRTYDDLNSIRSGESSSDMSRWPFTVERNPDNNKQPVIKGDIGGHYKFFMNLASHVLWYIASRWPFSILQCITPIV